MLKDRKTYRGVYSQQILPIGVAYTSVTSPKKSHVRKVQPGLKVKNRKCSLVSVFRYYNIHLNENPWSFSGKTAQFHLIYFEVTID